MWGEQNLLRKRDELIQKLKSITPIPATEIDELRSCKGQKLKRLISEIEKLHDEVLVQISAKTKTIASHTNARNKLKNQQSEIEWQKAQIIQEIDAFEEGSQEYTDRLEGLQSLINEGRALPAKIIRYDNEINAATDAKTVLEIVLIEESIKRTATNKDETRTLDTKIAKLKSADKTNEEIRADLADLASEVTQVTITDSSTYEAEKLLAERRRAKQSTSIDSKPQATRAEVGARTTPIPLTEDGEY
jgi:DNA repair exonuclease SbcCD ATPase subunit